MVYAENICGVVFYENIADKVSVYAKIQYGAEIVPMVKVFGKFGNKGSYAKSVYRKCILVAKILCRAELYNLSFTERTAAEGPGGYK